MKANQMYSVKFKLGKVTKVPDKYASFDFSMQTIKPSFKVTSDGLRSNGIKNKMSLSGSIETADIEKGSEVEKLLTATQNGKALKINWQHNDATKTHNFIMDNIERSKSVSNINLQWNGGPMNMEAKGENAVAVPSLGDFKVLNVAAINEAQQYASVQFSDAIAVGQDLNGL